MNWKKSLNKKVYVVSRDRGLWVGVDTIDSKVSLVNIMMGEELVLRLYEGEVHRLKEGLDLALAAIEEEKGL